MQREKSTAISVIRRLRLVIGVAVKGRSAARSLRAVQCPTQWGMAMEEEVWKLALDVSRHLLLSPLLIPPPSMSLHETPLPQGVYKQPGTD